jgi:DNA mismatch repair protein MutS
MYRQENFLTAQGNAEYIDKLSFRILSLEVLIKKIIKIFQGNLGEDYHSFYLEDWIYKEDYAFEILTKHFETISLKGWY